MVHSWPFEFIFRINTAQLPIGMEGFRYDEQSVGTKRQDASHTEKPSLFLLKGREIWGGEGRGGVEKAEGRDGNEWVTSIIRSDGEGFSFWKMFKNQRSTMRKRSCS